jgi:hypothetical protein
MMKTMKNIEIQSDPSVKYNSLIKNPAYHAAKQQFLLMQLCNIIDKYSLGGALFGNRF